MVLGWGTSVVLPERMAQQSKWEEYWGEGMIPNAPPNRGGLKGTCIYFPVGHTIP